MRIEIINDDMDGACCAIRRCIEHFFGKQRKVPGRSSVAHGDDASAAFRLHRHEDRLGAVPFVLGILSVGMVRSGEHR